MEMQKKAPASAAILAAAVLWGVIGLWNRTLMAAGLSPFSIVVVRNLGGMVLLAAFFVPVSPGLGLFLCTHSWFSPLIFSSIAGRPLWAFPRHYTKNRP